MSMRPVIHEKCKDCFYKKMYNNHKKLMDSLLGKAEQSIEEVKDKEEKQNEKDPLYRIVDPL